MLKGLTVSNDIFLGFSEENLSRIESGDSLIADLSVMAVNWVILVTIGSDQGASRLPANNGGKFAGMDRLVLHIDDSCIRELRNGKQAHCVTASGCGFDIFLMWGQDEMELAKRINCTGQLRCDLPRSDLIH